MRETTTSVVDFYHMFSPVLYGDVEPRYCTGGPGLNTALEQSAGRSTELPKRNRTN